MYDSNRTDCDALGICSIVQSVFDICWSMTLDPNNPLNEEQPMIWSEAMLEYMQWRESIQKKSTMKVFFDSIHSEQRNAILKYLNGLSQESSNLETLDIECLLQIGAKGYRWFRLVLAPSRGEMLLLCGGLIDIHDRKLQDEESGLLLTRYGLISLALTEGPWDMGVVPADPVNPLNEIWWSDQFRQVLGFDDEKDMPGILGYWSERIHKEDQQRVLDAFSAHISDHSGKTPYSIDYRIYRKHGELLWVHANGYTVRDTAGVPIRVAGTIRDINHEKRQMIESQEKLSGYQEILSTLSKKEELAAIMSSGNPLVEQLGSKIEKYAKVDAPVLITGESGVGKEVVTDLIHQLSDRKDAPLLKINCGAIPDFLLESELFGYEEGAFSGARKGGKIGFFELADNGTVLLDEIGDLPLPLQVKILRFVQSRDFYRVGGKKLIKVNTRIIAATNRHLEEMVAERLFREDLYYRLQVLTIHIPPLRERPDDIIPLALHFMDVFNRKYGMNKVLSQEVFGIFGKYSWKGNIRELENQIERLVVTTDGDTITADAIPSNIQNETISDLKRSVSETVPLYQDAKDRFEREYLQRALDAYGSTRKAAASIGVDHSTLVKKAGRYGIDLMKWRR